MTNNETPTSWSGSVNSADGQVRSQSTADPGQFRGPVTSTVVEIDLRVSAKRRFTEPAWQQNHRMRMLLAGTCPGDYIKLRVSRWTIPPVGLSDLLPPGARVQVSADDAQTVREWEALLEAAR